jgi:FkbH-like protein
MVISGDKIMSELTFLQVKKRLNKKKSTNLSKVNISILRNITVDQVEDYIKYYGLQSDLDIECKFGRFDNIFQDILASDSELVNQDSDVILVFYHLEMIYRQLSYLYPSFTSSERESATENIVKFVENCLFEIRNRSNAVVLWPSFELYVVSPLGIFDNHYNDGINDFILDINRKLSFVFSKFLDCFLICSQSLVSRIGYNDFYDQERRISAASPYSLVALREYALESVKYIRALKGLSKKVIVCDCDNTIWGGIVGEDGVQNLQIGSGALGGIFEEFQHMLKTLSKNGIVLALCSKNNEEDVWEVFERHHGMVLQKNDIAAYRINWKNKIENIKSIAEELNLGLDSFVFIDDSDFECQLVRDKLSNVTVIHMTKNPIEVINTINEKGFFDRYSLTNEDVLRTKMYISDSFRRKSTSNVVDISSYIQSLEVNVQVSYCNSSEISRVSQLTQKTNQFNLTGKRYTEQNIKEMYQSSNFRIFTLDYNDKFGSLGLVGVAIVKIDRVCNLPTIDTFLMSCRALGRSVEHVFLDTICQKIYDMGYSSIKGIHIPTKKNKQTEDFYIRNGFEVVVGNELSLELLLPMPKVECIEKNQFKSVSFINFMEKNNV